MTDLIVVPGWVWPVTWTSLVLALLVMLGVFAWVLFHKAMTVMAALGELADRTSVLDVAESEHVHPAIALLASARDIRDREDTRRQHRADRRHAKRAGRIDRARSITVLDREAKEAIVDRARTRFSPETTPGQRPAH